mmetsp:Transcript_3218/g.7467  ORF Transcript_3218/g.7467 Transcript_3218/m.7467 type:complete len:136 (+) Transcript_3218:322-729(+)
MAEDGATVDVTKIEISPNPAPIGAELNMEIEFTTSENIPDAHWEVRYTVDMTATRHIVEVGSSETVSYEAGARSMKFHAAGIELEGIKKSWLNNVGLLLAVLIGKDSAEIVQVSMVTQVSKTPDGLQRLIISPLD